MRVLLAAYRKIRHITCRLMNFFTVELSISCVCPYCASDNVEGSCATQISLGQFGVIAPQLARNTLPPDAEFDHEEHLLLARCKACQRTFSLNIESSAGDAHTLRALEEPQAVAASFSDEGMPVALQVGDYVHPVEWVKQHTPYGGAGLTTEFELYPKRFKSLFGRPPYGRWELRLKPGLHHEEFMFSLGPLCEISVSPPLSLNETRGDLLSVTVVKADQEMFALLPKGDLRHAHQHVPSKFLSVAGLTVALATERRLCEFVWQELRRKLAKHDKQWWRKVLDLRSIEKIERRANPKGYRKTPRIRDLHKYMTLGEARSVIECHWDQVFADTFSGKQRLLGSVAEMEEIRNEVAHGRPICFREYERCVDVSERIGQFLGL
jgi:hypothetical protein